MSIHYFLLLNIIPLYSCITFVYPSINWWVFGWFPLFYSYEWCCWFQNKGYVWTYIFLWCPFFLQYSLCSHVVLFSDTFHFYTLTDKITYTYDSFIWLFGICLCFYNYKFPLLIVLTFFFCNKSRLPTEVTCFQPEQTRIGAEVGSPRRD